MKYIFLTIAFFGVLPSHALAAAKMPEISLKVIIPKACLDDFEAGSHFIERQAALKVSSVGYRRFIITGGPGKYKIKLPPDGYTAIKGTVHSVKEVLAIPASC